MCCGLENKKVEQSHAPDPQKSQPAPAGILDKLKGCFTADAGRRALNAVATQVGKTIAELQYEMRRGQQNFERAKLDLNSIESSLRQRFR